MRIFPYRTHDEKVDGVVITLADVSRLKRAEEFAENVIATVSVPLVVLDGDLRIISANAAFFKDFEVEPSDIASTRIFELEDSQLNTPEVRGALEEILAGGIETRGLEVEGESRRGRRSLSLNARRLAGRGGEPLMILLAAEDITERKRAEETLTEAGRALTEQVRLRTRLALSLTEEENFRRRRLAQALHDNIQQLIVAAKMGLDGLQEKTTEIDLLKSIRLAQESLEKALDSARSLTAELSPPILYQAGLVRALEWLCGEMREKSGLDVECRLEKDEEPQNEGIKAFIFQSVRELLFNVIRHARVQKAELRMTRTDESLMIEVVDYGVGIEADKLKMIHEGSAGLGLFTIREHLSLLDGKIEIKTSRGSGTVVSLSLPLRQYAKADGRSLGGPGSVPGAKQAETSRSAPRIKVLLVDDHPIVRQGIATVLRNAEDIEVVGEAGDGHHALDLTRRLRPDVVIMDVSMPDMNGAEATKRILSEVPGVKVIGLSMHVEKEMAAMMRNAGAVTYLTKGGPSEDLVTAIRQCGSLELSA